MARREQDREDILAEATALVERVELQIAGETDPIVVGFRRNPATALKSLRRRRADAVLADPRP